MFRFNSVSIDKSGFKVFGVDAIITIFMFV